MKVRFSTRILRIVAVVTFGAHIHPGEEGQHTQTHTDLSRVNKGDNEGVYSLVTRGLSLVLSCLSRLHVFMSHHVLHAPLYRGGKEDT